MIVFDEYIDSTFLAVDDVAKSIITLLKSENHIQDKHILFKINFMLREILNNAIEHGNHFDPDKR